MSDEKIILEIRHQNEEVMAYVIQKYSKLLWKIASAVLVNVASVQDVEECVADTFIHLWQYPEKYEAGRGKLSTYLSLVARTKAIDCYRQAVRWQMVSMEEESVAYGAEPLMELTRQEDKRKVWNCINELGENDREVIVRRYYYEQKPKQIAIALNLSKKQVENRLYHAKQKLREMMDDLEGV